MSYTWLSRSPKIARTIQLTTSSICDQPATDGVDYNDTFPTMKYFNCLSLPLLAILSAVTNSRCQESSNIDPLRFRAAPLVEIATDETLSVRSFGAIPDDDRPDTDAIKAAIAKAIEIGKPCRIAFEKGKYLISNSSTEDSSPPERFMALSVESAKDLVFDGQGAIFLLNNPRSGLFRFLKCKNIIVQNIVIDYDPLPFSAGYVRAIHNNPDAIDIEVAPGHPLLSAPYFSRETGGYGYPIDRDIAGRLKDNSPNVFFSKSVTDLGNGLFRIFMRSSTPSSELDYIEIGDRYVQIARQPSGDLFRAIKSDDITIKEVTSFASAGVNYVAVDSERLNLIKCKALVAPGRWMGGNADGVHVQNSRVGPWLEGCEFEGLGDDGFNFYTRPFFVSKNVSANSFVLSGWKEDEIQTGDTLTFFDPISGSILAKPRVVSIDTQQNIVTLDSNVSKVVIGSQREATQVYNESFSNGFVIKDCRFANLRRFGTLFKGKNGLIQGNSYFGTSSSAIMALNEPSWPEGLFSKQIWILNNHIDQCGFDRDFRKGNNWGVVSIQAESLRGKLKEPNLLEDIQLIGNKISGWTKMGFVLSNIKNAKVTTNEFSAATDAASVCIKYSHCENALFYENVFPTDLSDSSKIASPISD